MQLCRTKLSAILEIEPYMIFFNERIIGATSNFQGMLTKNDPLLQIEEIVRVYANSKYLDRNLECTMGTFFWLSIGVTYKEILEIKALFYSCR